MGELSADPQRRFEELLAQARGRRISPDAAKQLFHRAMKKLADDARKHQGE